MVAAGDGNIDAVKRFLDSGVSPNAQDSSGYSPLHAAASYGHIDILELLVNRGGDVMLKDVDGDTPLHVCEDRTCAEFLLSHGAKYDCGNNEGKTPIWYAVEEDFADMIEYYLEKKILTPQLVERIRSEVMEDGWSSVSSIKQMTDIALVIYFIQICLAMRSNSFCPALVSLRPLHINGDH
ncbi:hypothetical protein WA171_003928 [Blastocystis sp. BT1]